MKTFIDSCKVENDCLIIPKSAMLYVADASFHWDDYDMFYLLTQIGNELADSNPDGDIADFLSGIARVVSKESRELLDYNYELIKELERSQIVI